MTKRHFIELARIMRETKAPARVRDAIASYCAAQNPRFNRARWFAFIKGECGPSGGAIKRPRRSLAARIRSGETEWRPELASGTKANPLDCTPAEPSR